MSPTCVTFALNVATPLRRPNWPVATPPPVGEGKRSTNSANTGCAAIPEHRVQPGRNEVRAPVRQVRPRAVQYPSGMGSKGLAAISSKVATPITDVIWLTSVSASTLPVAVTVPACAAAPKRSVAQEIDQLPSVVMCFGRPRWWMPHFVDIFRIQPSGNPLGTPFFGGRPFAPRRVCGE